MVGKRVKRMWDEDPFCALCGDEINSAEDANRDHILPRSYGGCGGDINMQLTHKKCNTMKGNDFSVCGHSTEWISQHMATEPTLQKFYQRLLDEVKACNISYQEFEKELRKKDMIIELLSEELFRLRTKDE